MSEHKTPWNIGIFLKGTRRIIKSYLMCGIWPGHHSWVSVEIPMQHEDGTPCILMWHVCEKCGTEDYMTEKFMHLVRRFWARI